MPSLYENNLSWLWFNWVWISPSSLFSFCDNRKYNFDFISTHASDRRCPFSHLLDLSSGGLGLHFIPLELLWKSPRFSVEWAFFFRKMTRVRIWNSEAIQKRTKMIAKKQTHVVSIVNSWNNRGLMRFIREYSHMCARRRPGWQIPLEWK